MGLCKSRGTFWQENLDLKLPSSQLKKGEEKKTGLAFGYQVF